LESSSSLTALSTSAASSFFAADLRGVFAAAFSTGAAWNIGTGIAGAFFFDLEVFSSETSVVVSTALSLALDFLAARLRGLFGEIAMIKILYQI
jgi:hypothetical protein